jgi:hypothetical protein
MSGGTWRARIDTANGLVRGAGLLVAPKQVLTCAHVVDGLDAVLVTFPGAPNAPAIPATVEWRGPWRREGDPGDIAIVELDLAPPGTAPCQFAGLEALRPRQGKPGYTLRALGFPDGAEVTGDYATVNSSSDRVLGYEWLQADAEQAHLQRLAEGFSGAGLYLPESGEVVVGMLTDAILDDDRGGYIGRMLPLSVIRRYWPDIDDLLPLPWLEPRSGRAQLRTTVKGAVIRTDLGSIFATAFPAIACQEDFQNPWEAIRYVGESVVGEDRLRTFLITLAPHLDPGTRSRLGDWAQRWRPDWAAEIGHGKPPRTSIVVTMRTPTRNGKTHVEVAARPLVNARWIGPEEVVTVRRDQVREKAEKLVSAAVRKAGAANPMIEFAVGTDDLALPFDEWHFEVPGASRPRPMRSVPLVVWNVSRLDPSNATSAFVRERWQALNSGVTATVEPVDCTLPYDYEDFYSMLDANEKLGALAYASVPRRGWLDAALDTGIPVMVWCRQECRQDEAHAAHMVLLAQLTAALAGTDPHLLPGKVATLRKEAMSPVKGGEGHYGRRLTLFWDDPARLPDPPLGSWS